MTNKYSVTDNANNAGNYHNPANQGDNGAAIESNEDTKYQHDEGDTDDVPPTVNTDASELGGGIDTDERFVDNQNAQNYAEIPAMFSPIKSAAIPIRTATTPESRLLLKKSL